MDAYDQWMVRSNLARIESGETTADETIQTLRDNGYNRVADAVEAATEGNGMNETVEISVADIREGDSFYGEDGMLYWTAIEDAKQVGTEIQVRVRHIDGGTSIRVWDWEDANTLRLSVDRKV